MTSMGLCLSDWVERSDNGVFLFLNSKVSGFESAG